MAFSRADRSLVAEWWFTVDRTLLALFLGLIAAGLVVTLAASPAVALRKGYDAFHFVGRHVVFAGAGIAVMLAVSLLSPPAIRRLAAVLLLAALAAMVAVLLWGEEINGARRWVRLGALSLQPSELAKPALAVLLAWAFARTGRDRHGDLLAVGLAFLMYAATVIVLVQQPDVGQTVLVSLVFGALFVVSGQPLTAAAGLAVAGLAGLFAAYRSLDYVRLRVDRFLSPVPGDLSQTDRALQSFAEGGLFGRGPGEGTIKTTLPDAHTDFIFAVIAEEYGAIACLALIAVLAVVVIRPILKAADSDDRFVRLAVTALALIIAAQALINMGVNVGLLPAKGMTLPFISTGGSSLIAMSLTAGLILALTRRRATLRPSSHAPPPIAAAPSDRREWLEQGSTR
jgi:cell division protein FtsW